MDLLTINLNLGTVRSAISMKPLISNHLPKEVWCSFAGEINGDTVNRMLGTLGIATANQVSTVHLLIQSPGGQIKDGIALYNCLSKLPVEIVAYNSGGVQSAAVLLFLAAKRRVASDTATFMIHRSNTTVPSRVSATVLREIAADLETDDVYIEQILRTHVTMLPEYWAAYQARDLIITAKQALEFSFIHEIGQFTRPPGSILFNI